MICINMVTFCLRKADSEKGFMLGVFIGISHNAES